MPNIEIHGFNKEVAEIWREQIFKASERKDFFGDMVVTIFPTEVKDINGDAPFLRLASTTNEKGSHKTIDDVLEMLEVFEIDTEVQTLDRFIEGKGNFSRNSRPRTSY